jgi:leader peptidase (prepilin peptidase) / N-methyltransferase
MIFSTLEQATGLPEWFAYVFLFTLGAATGSFLNVVIHRVPLSVSIVSPGSACPQCGSSIRPYDNIPVIGWLLLGGKCRTCKEPISVRYPAVELLTGALFLLVYSQIGFTPILPVVLAFASAIVALVFIDAEHMILPNVITYPLLALAFVVRLLFPLLALRWQFPDVAQWPVGQLALTPVAGSVVAAILGALAGGGSLWLVGELWKRLRGVEAMGLGDVKMMLGVGALLGWRLTLLSIFLAAFTGAACGALLIVKNRDTSLQTQIPFGIFLGIGSVAALLFGERLIAWYLSSFVL